MRTPFIVGNWKMHGTRAEAVALAGAVRKAAEGAPEVEVGVAPPFPFIEAVSGICAGGRVKVGGQDCHSEAKGAFTGSTAGPMLRDLGCAFVIVGHSERRHGLGESDECVGKKLRAALASGLIPIACVGELLEERERGATEHVVRRQLQAAFEGLNADLAGRCVVAYEPVWAIGTGRTATPAQAQEVHSDIRRFLGRLLGDPVASTVRIQYGGSVKADNIDALMTQPDIDGALVGGASLDAAAFTRIVQFQRS
ncbi:MAG: triose-phosphate isomerase [Planctomycetes bacterium]|nr:triose-phosphate isomerase [Planctomycetota bacterium]